MSTQTQSPTTLEAKARAAEFATNYPFIGEDGHFGPITVANINREVEVLNRKTGEIEERDIVNLCLRTGASKGSNATISAPTDWNKFGWVRPGMLVEVVIEAGYIKKIVKSVAEAVGSKKGAAKVNAQIEEQEDDAAADAAAKELLDDTKDVPAADVPTAETENKPF